MRKPCSLVFNKLKFNSVLATVATGGTSAIFTKGFIKPAQGGITSIHRDIDNFVLGRDRKPLCVSQSVLGEVLVDGQVEGVLKEIHIDSCKSSEK